ncbi:MAG: hypothetical protein ACREX0_07740, partial [Noviherbaspirillum sp.]
MQFLHVQDLRSQSEHMQSSHPPEFDNKAEKPTLRQRIRCLPIVGPSLAWLYGIVRFNAVRREIAQDLAEIRDLQQAHHMQVSQRLDRFDALNVEHRLRELDALNLGALNIAARLNALDNLDLATRLDRLESLDIANRLARVEQMLGSIVAANNERDNRIAVLLQEFRRNKAPAAAPATVPATSGASPVAVAASTFDMDSFYLEFEGRFRGTREDIQGRLKAYLPYVSHLVGDKNARIADVGCGRGEWLE